MKKLNFIDLFAECGGLSEGFLQSGHFNGLAHVEWETTMVNTFRLRLSEKWGDSQEEAKSKVIQFDIQKTEELISGNWTDDTKALYAPDNSEQSQNGLDEIIKGQKVDVIIGGTPCQAYSIHGRAIEGFYEIERISFGTYKKPFGEMQVDMPSLRIKIGKYHPLDTRLIEGIVPRMANQVWSRQTLNKYIQKTQSYLADNGLMADTIQEPKATYGYKDTQSDYIE